MWRKPAAGGRRNVGNKAKVVAIVLVAGVLAAIAAAVSLIAGAEGVLLVAITAGIAAVAGVVAPYVIDPLLEQLAVRSSWDRAGDGIVRPLAPEDDQWPSAVDVESPAELLRAEREVVRFRGRDRELHHLARWCDGDSSVVTLCWGGAGVGKTRLARELGWSLNEKWDCGFLQPGQVKRAVAALPMLRSPVLLMVDQAESFDDLHSLVAAALHHTGPGKLRVLLLARSAGDWWERRLVSRLSSADDRTALRNGSFELLADAAGPSDQQQVFERALRSFAHRLDLEVPSTRLLTVDRGPAPPVLNLHAAALAALLGRGQVIGTDAAVFVELLEHEAHYWQASALASGLDLDERQWRQAVAVATLIGADTPEAGEELLAGLPVMANSRSAVPALSRWLHDLYPAPPSEWIGPLQPDALMHALILTEITAKPELIALLERSLTTDQRRHRVLAVLARIARHDERGAEALTSLLNSSLDTLIEPAMDTAPNVEGPLPSIIAAVVRSAAPDPHLDARVDRCLTERDLFELLAELAEVICRRQLDTARRENDAEMSALLLGKLGERLDRLGRYEQALEVTVEAVDLWRTLVEQQPAAHQPNLATVVTSLSLRLDQLGHAEKALEAAEDAVNLWRVLVEQQPDAHQPNLAAALTNLGLRLDRLGSHKRAVAAEVEAVDLSRRLASQDPDSHLPSLGIALTSLGVGLRGQGRYEAAFEVETEAIDLWRGLAAQRPDAHLPNVAGALVNLSHTLEDLGRYVEVLAAAEEAVHLLRGLAAQRPDAHLPDLVGAMNILGEGLRRLGRHAEAHGTASEAAGLCRALAAQRPEAHLPDLATALNSLGLILDVRGRHAEALGAISEAVDLWRVLAKEQPDAHLPRLASALTNLGLVMGSQWRYGEALKSTSEAVGLWRVLAKEQPDAHLAHLATALNNLGSCLEEMGQHSEATQVFEEVQQTWRLATQCHPGMYGTQLAAAEALLRQRGSTDL